MDEEAINDYIIKLTGKASLPEALDIGHNYTVKIQGSITAKTETDRFDGGRIYYYRFEPVIVEVITETGKTIRARDTRRASQRLRSAIWKLWQDKQINREFDEYYEEIMRKLIKQVLS